MLTEKGRCLQVDVDELLVEINIWGMDLVEIRFAVSIISITNPFFLRDEF